MERKESENTTKKYENNTINKEISCGSLGIKREARQLRVSLDVSAGQGMRSREDGRRERVRIQQKNIQTPKKTNGRSGVFSSVIVAAPASQVHPATVCESLTVRLRTTGDEGVVMTGDWFFSVQSLPVYKSRPYDVVLKPTSAFGV